MDLQNGTNNNKESKMALSKEVRCDRNEVVGRFKHIQCRTATIVIEDDV